MRLSLFLAAFALIFGASLAASTENVSATARASSRFTISTLKLASKHRPSSQMDADCVSKISDDALVAEFQILLKANFTAEEVRQLDAFYSSSLLDMYMQDALQKIQTQRFGVDQPAVELSHQEWTQIESLQSSVAGSKYSQIVSTSTPEWRQTVGSAVSKLLSTCKRQ